MWTFVLLFGLLSCSVTAAQSMVPCYSPPLYRSTIKAAVHFALRHNAISGRCELIPETRWLFNLHGSVLTANDSSLFNYYCCASDVQIGDTRWNAMGTKKFGSALHIYSAVERHLRRNPWEYWQAKPSCDVFQIKTAERTHALLKPLY